MSKGRLEGKIALVTGAAQGIGEETTIALAREGAIVVISDIDDMKGKLIADKIGKSAIYLHLDVRSERDWSHTIKTILQKLSKVAYDLNWDICKTGSC